MSAGASPALSALTRSPVVVVGHDMTNHQNRPSVSPSTSMQDIAMRAPRQRSAYKPAPCLALAGAHAMKADAAFHFSAGVRRHGRQLHAVAEDHCAGAVFAPSPCANSSPPRETGGARNRVLLYDTGRCQVPACARCRQGRAAGVPRPGPAADERWCVAGAGGDTPDDR